MLKCDFRKYFKSLHSFFVDISIINMFWLLKVDMYNELYKTLHTIGRHNMNVIVLKKLAVF
jgi:hypothetical protein